MTAFGQVFDRCPLAWMRDDALDARQHLDDWTALQRHGAMLSAGGLLDQPATYVEAMQVIDDETARCREIAKARTSNAALPVVR